ncbi:hypothetical protein CRENBAI_016844 [Crenichthys baileyi]|uniref:Uncharacterized protein n=1 Tax=Crenichthys baileyi TaxID=28760 RepID=A0AAV9SB15_9TELE
MKALKIGQFVLEPLQNRNSKWRQFVLKPPPPPEQEQEVEAVRLQSPPEQEHLADLQRRLRLKLALRCQVDPQRKPELRHQQDPQWRLKQVHKCLEDLQRRRKQVLRCLEDIQQRLKQSFSWFKTFNLCQGEPDESRRWRSNGVRTLLTLFGGSAMDVEGWAACAADEECRRRRLRRDEEETWKAWNYADMGRGSARHRTQAPVVRLKGSVLDTGLETLSGKVERCSAAGRCQEEESLASSPRTAIAGPPPLKPGLRSSPQHAGDTPTE